MGIHPRGGGGAALRMRQVCRAARNPGASHTEEGADRGLLRSAFEDLGGLGAVRDACGPGHARAVGAAVERAADLDAVAYHLDAAVLADGRERVDRALEAVERVRATGTCASHRRAC